MAIRLKDTEASPMIAINTTPLIDVMLVLLIMLIITIPVELHSINMDTPDTPSKASASNSPVVLITITANGEYLINQQTLNAEQLDKELLSLSHSPNSPEIHIKPNSGSAFGALAHVLAAAQNLKLTKIGIDDSP
ncbi:MAG: biopolymer transporter ExbD [Betaproteobacteria bacterium]|nr:biopolymer transporter ExbD [Betaproteobacteria bacterium]MDE2422630.1 biopolymer transporter ExbD [Betaproteobacteria bacterium]